MQQFELREIGEDYIFDPTIIYENTPFTQARFYGDWQKNLGRTVRRFLVSNKGEVVAYFQIIKYPLLFGKSYFYIPYGPVVKDFSEDFFNNLKKELILIAKMENVVFIRLDFTPPVSSEILSKFFTKAPLYTYHSAYFQPRLEWFLDLDKSEDELLMAMHGKARYCIRLAKRKEIAVEITKDFGKYFNDFYKLMSETAERNGFNLHNRDYYESIFKNLSYSNSYLSIARYGGKILVIDLIIVFGKIANYVFGGSSNEERNRMPTYAAQWEAILHAKQLDCDYYNFGGIATEGQIYKGWEGLTVFKKKFGGHELKHSDFFDVVISQPWYRLYNLRKFIKKKSP